MKVVVGKLDSPTPMLATVISSAEFNPYWNVPPDLTQKLIAPRVLAQGTAYLRASRYEVMSDWSEAAQIIDPQSIDWKAVAAGTLKIRVRQEPGPGNAMGSIKFVTHNQFGIYLHDTPNKELFALDSRLRSNGCVRVEDAQRLAHWLLPQTPATVSAGQIVAVDQPVPVYITYLTATVDESGGLTFIPDRYGRDEAALKHMEDRVSPLQTAAI